MVSPGRGNRAGLRWIGWRLALMAGAVPASAHLRLPAVLGDHVVLQADRAVAVWGWADPGTAIRVEFADRRGIVQARAAGVAAASGKWHCLLPALVGGTAGSLQIRSSSGETWRGEDALIGEVWIGSGQSNMSYPIRGYNTPTGIVARSKTAPGSRSGHFAPTGILLPDRAGRDAPYQVN